MADETPQEELTRLRIEKEVFEKGDDRWASKLTELLVYGLVGLILVGAIAAWLSLIYIHPSNPEPVVCSVNCK